LDYKAVELLEVSCLAVPANAEALRKSLAAHSGGEVSEAQVRKILGAAFDRADAEETAEVTSVIRALDNLDDIELLSLAAAL
jgi:hypothetical protein